MMQFFTHVLAGLFCYILLLILFVVFKFKSPSFKLMDLCTIKMGHYHRHVNKRDCGKIIDCDIVVQQEVRYMT